MSVFVREGPVVVQRVEEGEIDKNTGRALPDTKEQFTLSGNIQPISGEDLNRAPEGARLVEMKTLFLHQEIDEKDIILYKGKEYQVELTQEWDPHFSTIPHWRYMMQLKGEDF